MLLLYFTPPSASTKLLIQSFCSLNEILHKLTSCHFILRNKTLNDLCLKIPPFSPLRTKNCTIHQRTITQIYDLSRHHFSLKLNFFYKNFRFTVTFITPAKIFLPPFKSLELHFQNFTS